MHQIHHLFKALSALLGILFVHAFLTVEAPSTQHFCYHPLMRHLF